MTAATASGRSPRNPRNGRAVTTYETGRQPGHDVLRPAAPEDHYVAQRGDFEGFRREPALQPLERRRRTARAKHLSQAGYAVKAVVITASLGDVLVGPGR